MTGHAPRVGDLGDACQVGDGQLGVADRLQVDDLGALGDRLGKGLRLVAVHPHGPDAHAGQRVGEQRDRAAVEARGGDDLVSGGAEGEQRGRDGAHAAGKGQPGDAAFQGGDPLLQDVGGRVHDPGIDVAKLFQRKEPRGVRGVLEDIAGGLPDGHGARARLCVRRVPGVQGERVKSLDLLVCHLVISFGRIKSHPMVFIRLVVRDDASAQHDLVLVKDSPLAGGHVAQAVRQA